MKPHTGEGCPCRFPLLESDHRHPTGHRLRGRFAGEVFGHKKFKEWAAENAVLLEVDSPKGKVLSPSRSSTTMP